jgi:DNA-binding NarL/FixJ family response regulator
MCVKAGLIERRAAIPRTTASLTRPNEKPRGSWHQTAMSKPLTARETEVLALLAKGESVRVIADAFDIAERSAQAHIQMVSEKLGANGRRACRRDRLARGPDRTLIYDSLGRRNGTVKISFPSPSVTTISNSGSS